MLSLVMCSTRREISLSSSPSSSCSWAALTQQPVYKCLINGRAPTAQAEVIISHITFAAARVVGAVCRNISRTLRQHRLVTVPATALMLCASIKFVRDNDTSILTDTIASNCCTYLRRACWLGSDDGCSANRTVFDSPVALAGQFLLERRCRVVVRLRRSAAATTAATAVATG